MLSEKLDPENRRKFLRFQIALRSSLMPGFQLCVRAGIAEKGAIAVTEPRRVAAVSLATRVAVEMGTDIGGVVGYHVRFENATTHKTKIEYMTDGIVLR